MRYVVDGTIIHNGVKYYGDPSNGQLTYWDAAVATEDETAALVKAGALVLEAQAKGAAATQDELDALRAQVAAFQAAQESAATDATQAADATVADKSGE